ncbi:hypothetical protein [Rhizobium bangladeshense]|uniref:hypothetical protein n=1 Tax=Rhizobium bangladeshense TaxID=1138189 RepID=UPI000A5FD526|nr:hypothetical protein [Rhizobium bangladeshense]
MVTARRIHPLYAGWLVDVLQEISFAAPTSLDKDVGNRQRVGIEIRIENFGGVFVHSASGTSAILRLKVCLN